MNLFKRFLRLIPQPPLRIGDVIQVADGVATVSEIGGGLVNARGDVQVGDRVFFRDGVIEGPAPNLPVEDISV
ncbi:hypothetical protein [Acidovorax phage ACPWH]|nr:hypothetical protein [Acidovorax phage ACPWH]QXV72260.1 hypothetical protein Acf1_00063 [Acidovorax phage ACF1]